jgi:SAM-dependent methyltransferase
MRWKVALPLALCVFSQRDFTLHMSELKRERRHWEDLASSDPMWVILTEPGREGRWTPEDFFRNGREEIDRLFSALSSLGISARPAVALDFGCGLGRLTQALCERFGRVHGIDISETMVAGARSYNRHGDRAVYHANAVDRLPMIPDGAVDLVYSRLVLQHIPRAAQENYIAEFARILAPGGVAVFQVLTRAKSPVVRLRQWIRNRAPNAYRMLRDLVTRKSRWELNPVPLARVREILEAGGVTVKSVVSDEAGGAVFESCTVFVVKR